MLCSKNCYNLPLFWLCALEHQVSLLFRLESSIDIILLTSQLRRSADRLAQYCILEICQTHTSNNIFHNKVVLFIQYVPHLILYHLTYLKHYDVCVRALACT